MAEKNKKNQEENEELKRPPEEESETQDKQEKEGKKNAKAAKELEKVRAERDDYLDALKRERADFENYKKRNADLVSKAFADGVADAVGGILPVIDNLERAIAAAEEESPVKKGVEMVLKQFNDVLTGMGVTTIEAEGQKFDPNFHHAVMQVEPQEGQESGTVVEVLQKGYQLKGKILRYAMVKVVQ